MNQERNNKPDLMDFLGDHPRFVDILAPAVIYWAEHLVVTETLGKNNLQEAAEHVNSGNGGLLVVSNHISMLDAKAMFSVKNEIISFMPFEVFWANKFVGVGVDATVDNRKNIIAGRVGAMAANKAKIDLVAIPQEDTGREAIIEADRIIRETRGRTLGIGGVLGIFPEGTRSKDAVLHKAKQGAMNRLFRDRSDIQEKTLILPMSVRGTNDVLSHDLKKVRPFKPIIISYGIPFTYADATKEMERYNMSLADVAMLHIARLLPENMWGEYAEAFKPIIKR